ncbi:MAG: hypothetical protein PVI23_06855 [Maricaulaceae bacterium]|jgi:hypothetical protein
MRLSLITVLCAFAFAATPAAAAEGGHGGGNEGPSNRIQASFTLPSATDELDEGGDAGPRAVDIPTLSIPSFSNGELHGYMFVSVRLIVTEGRDPWRIRERAHLARDRLIRVGHRVSLASPDDPTRIDPERARQIIRESLADVVAIEDVERIEFLSVDAHAG